MVPHRDGFRRVCLLVLVSLLVSLVPPMAPRTTPVTAAPAMPLTSPDIPPPMDAGTTDLPASAAPTLGNAVESNHALTGTLDGTFVPSPEAGQIVYSLPGPFSLTRGTADPETQTLVIPLPPGVYDSIQIDATVTGPSGVGARSLLSARPVATPDAPVARVELLKIKNGVTSDTVTRRITLGDAIPRHVPAELILSCYSSKVNGTCT